MRRWLPLIILCAAQFVMVLDSSVMNVSISQIVDDLDTTVTGVQLAITMYALVMAAFMLAGAGLGNLWGTERVFAIGLLVYGLGSFGTGLSQNIVQLVTAWSLIEGLGAALVIPAIAALIYANYEGRDRATAYAAIGGVSGAAIAVGPLLGGWVTTAFTWRWVFFGETVVIIGILLTRKLLRGLPRAEEAGAFDTVGVVLSASGLGLAVFGILKTSTWGLIEPKAVPTIGGVEITPFGFSVVPFLILGGLGVLALFALWEERQQRLERATLVDLGLLHNTTMRAGLVTLIMLQIVMLGTFFALPVYLQIVQGLNAFETGLRIFPLSLALLAGSMIGPRRALRSSPRRVVIAGLATSAVAATIFVGAMDAAMKSAQFSLAAALMGLGCGLVISQLSNIIMSSAPATQSSEAGGLQGTAQNLGSSLGTAVIGAILFVAMGAAFSSALTNNEAIPEPVRQELQEITQVGLPVIPVDDAEAAMVDGGVSSDDAATIADDYGEAQLHGLERAFLAVAFLALCAMWPARRLPRGAAQAASPSAVA